MNLKEIRKSSGFTQEQLAKRIGVTQQQYSRYEVGTNKITLEMFLRILTICNLKMKVEKKRIETNNQSN